MSITTKSGDKGETGLLGGKRVPKDDARISAIGGIDELNAAVGVLRSVGGDVILRQAQDDMLEKIQHDLFALGAELANPDGNTKILSMTDAHVKPLEHAITELEKKLPPLKNFILPAGTPFAAHAHLARAICRRAEREIITLNHTAPLNPQLLIYLNRLSDLLFMLAREENSTAQQEETLWKSSPHL